MKNIALICCVVLSALCTLYSQNTRQFNFQISPGTSWFTTDDHLINSNGGQVNARITAKLEKPLIGNLFYTKGISLAFGQGGTLRHEIGGNLLPESTFADPALNQGDKPFTDGTDIGYKLRMLEIPLSLKYKLPSTGYSTYYIEGPIITTQVKLGAKGDVDNAVMELVDQNVGPDVHLLNFTWGFGGGIEYNINPDFSLLAGISFHRSLFDQLKNNGTKVITSPEGEIESISKENSKAKMNSIQLSFGVVF
ncbi:MAG: hypothetical protein KJP00_08785 [Bacteroidia bacterium]|nr:hypothetical protein [Bacteroidia bacterium]